MNKAPRLIQKKFRVSEREDILLQEKVKNSGLSLQNYLLRVSLGRKIKPFPADFDTKLKELYRSIRNIQGNLNQLAKSVNYGQEVSSGEIKKALLQVRDIADDIDLFLVTLKEKN